MSRLTRSRTCTQSQYLTPVNELSSQERRTRTTALDITLSSLRPMTDSFDEFRSFTSCHARDNQLHPRPKFSPSHLVPPPRVHYRLPRSLVRHYYATPTSYYTTSRPHNPTQNTTRPRLNEHSCMRATSLSAPLAQARAAALAFLKSC